MASTFFYDLFFTINEYNSFHDTVRQNDELRRLDHARDLAGLHEHRIQVEAQIVSIQRNKTGAPFLELHHDVNHTTRNAPIHCDERVSWFCFTVEHLHLPAL